MNTQQQDVRVTVRVERSLKDSADNLFERLGMNMTTAFTVFLRKAVAENAIPFPVSARPASTAGRLSSENITRMFSDTVAREAGEHTKQGFPIARYDAATRRAYLENVDGLREYVDEK